MRLRPFLLLGRPCLATMLVGVLAPSSAGAGPTKFTKQMNDVAQQLVSFPLTPVSYSTDAPFLLVAIRFPDGGDESSMAVLLERLRGLESADLAEVRGSRVDVADSLAKTAYYAQELFLALSAVLPAGSIGLVPATYRVESSQGSDRMPLLVTALQPPAAVVTLDFWAYSLAGRGGCENGTCKDREFEVSVSLSTPRRLIAPSCTTVNRVRPGPSTILMDCRNFAASVIDGSGTVCPNPLYMKAKAPELSRQGAFRVRDTFPGSANMPNRAGEFTTAFGEWSAAGGFVSSGESSFQFPVLPVFWSRPNGRTLRPPAGWPEGLGTWNGLLPKYVGIVLNALRQLDQESEARPALIRSMSLFDPGIPRRLGAPLEPGELLEGADYATCLRASDIEEWVRGSFVGGGLSATGLSPGDVANVALLREILVTERRAFAQSSKQLVEASYRGEFGRRMREVFERERRASRKEKWLVVSAIAAGVAGGVAGQSIWTSPTAYSAATRYAQGVGGKLEVAQEHASAAVAAGTALALTARGRIDRHLMEGGVLTLAELRAKLRAVYNEEKQSDGAPKPKQP